MMDFRAWAFITRCYLYCFDLAHDYIGRQFYCDSTVLKKSQNFSYFVLEMLVFQNKNIDFKLYGT